MANNARRGSFMDILHRNLYQKSAGRAIFDTASTILFWFIIIRLIAGVLLLGIILSFVAVIISANNAPKLLTPEDEKLFAYCKQHQVEIQMGIVSVVEDCKKFNIH